MQKVLEAANVMVAAGKFCYDFFGGMMDEHVAMKWTPLLATFFLFILTCNFSGLISGSGLITGFRPPNSYWNVTATLAFVVFFVRCK
jgi:F-type H+-transporting ATPase subunit a